MDAQLTIVGEPTEPNLFFIVREVRATSSYSSTHAINPRHYNWLIPAHILFHLLQRLGRRYILPVLET